MLDSIVDYDAGTGMPRGSDEENDGAESVGAASSLGSWAGRRNMETLPILLHGKVMVCVLCGRNSGERNPLLTGDEWGDEEVYEEKLGPFWPWYNYKECTDDKGVQHKRPYRKRCRICRRIFHGAAFLHNWGSISIYVKKITEKPDEHTSFMNAFRAWFQKKGCGSQCGLA